MTARSSPAIATAGAARSEARAELDPVERGERIVDKIVIQGVDLDGGDGKGRFAATGHLHAYTRAFGDPEERAGVWLHANDVTARFRLGERFAGFAYDLKLIAAMERWTNWTADLEILVNGRSLRRGPMLFENVVSGWPANVVALPAALLVRGENRITVANRGRHAAREAVMINRIEVVVRPADADLQLQRAPDIVRAGEPFLLRVRNVTGRPTRLEVTGGLRCLARRRDEDDDVFELVTDTLDNDQSAVVRAGDAAVAFRPRRVVHVGEPYRLLVGTDLNDDRIDESTDRTLDAIDETGLGNVVGFRLQLGRNHWRRPTAEEFASWFARLKRRGMRFWMEDGPSAAQTFAEADPASFAPAFVGTKFHEFCHTLIERSAELKDLRHAREVCFEQLRLRRERHGLPGWPFWVSEASMHLCLLATSPDCDVPIAEPVTSDHMVLYGSIKRTARLHGKDWGAHVAVQWFLGQGNTEDKLRRLRTTLHLAHMLGARIIYTESGLFKYVQFGMRWDEDHPYTRAARDILREFYAFTRVQPVAGEPRSSINVLYGHLESAFFYPDEVPLDTARSDGLRRLWYKWDRTEEDFGWLALKNLLRPIRQAALKGYPGDCGANHWFSANPHGGVDIIPIEDLAKNPLPVSFILGRNVMTDEVHASLCAYVRGGGILFLTAHQFNTEADPDREAALYRDGDLSELCGCVVERRTSELGSIAVERNDLLALPQPVYGFDADGSRPRLFAVGAAGCVALARDAATGAPVLVAKRIGAGWSVCFVGATTIGDARLKPFVDDVVTALARLARPEIHVADDAEVHLQEWTTVEDGTAVSKLFLLNIDWTAERPRQRAELAIGAKRLPVEVPHGAPTVLFRAGGLCFGASSPLTQIWDVRADARSVRFTAMGRDLERFTCLALAGPVRRVSCAGVELPIATACGRPDVVEFACGINTPQELLVEYD